MAKHRKHTRFGMISIPDSVPTKGLAMGLGVGLVGALVARYALNSSYLATQKASATAYDANSATGSQVWSVINKNLPTVGAALAAVAAYFIVKKKNPSLASALAIGAGAFGVTQGAFAMAQTLSPSFKGLTVVPLGGNRFGAMLTQDSQRFGAFVRPGGGASIPGYNRPAGQLSAYGASLLAQRQAAATRLAGVRRR